MTRTCAWCWAPYLPTSPNRRFCDTSCRNAMHSWRKRKVGTPGVKPGTSRKRGSEYRQITIQLPPDVYDILGKASVSRGEPMVGIVRSLIREHLGGAA